jgi:hypothetical protein
MASLAVDSCSRRAETHSRDRRYPLNITCVPGLLRDEPRCSMMPDERRARRANDGRCQARGAAGQDVMTQAYLLRARGRRFARCGRSALGLPERSCKSSFDSERAMLARQADPARCGFSAPAPAWRFRPRSDPRESSLFARSMRQDPKEPCFPPVQSEQDLEPADAP